jgi:hypothetical protein
MGFNFKTKPAKPVRGGSTKMFGKGRTGTQTPGQTATKPRPTGGKFPAGGTTKMFGKQSVKTAKCM